MIPHRPAPRYNGKNPFFGPAMRRILIIAPSWLGDIIMSQCLLKLLKKRDPSCRIDVYAPAYAHPIIRRMPEADGIIENPFAHHEFAFIKRRREGIKLRAARYDEAYILPNSWKSALVPFFARIPLRIGFKGESRYLLINSMRSNKKDYPRMADRYAALAWPLDQVTSSATLPAYEFPTLTTLPPSEELLARLKITPGRPMLALGCGANYGPAKLWPVEYFARVCDWWTGRGGQVLALGSKKDIPTVAAIASKLKAETAPYFNDIAGKTSLDEALDLTGACQAAICNDSGLMHTVAAAGVPQADIFGSTSTVYTPPLSEKAVCVESDESCHPCFERRCPKGTYECLRGIKPERVIAALEEVL